VIRRGVWARTVSPLSYAMISSMRLLVAYANLPSPASRRSWAPSPPAAVAMLRRGGMGQCGRASPGARGLQKNARFPLESRRPSF
jgi:hypothetical protein